MKKCRAKVFRMVSVILMLAMVAVAFHVSAPKAEAKKKENVVILYFSVTETTKGAAQKIKKTTKGKLLAIKAADPYTEDDVDYGKDDSRAAKEHKSANSPAESTVRPKISNLNAIKKAVNKADVVYIGYPIWWGEAPHIVYGLVENVNLKGKTVVPFCTSASSGLGSSAKNLKTKANISTKTKWLAGRNFYDVPSQKTVDKWIQGLK